MRLRLISEDPDAERSKKWQALLNFKDQTPDNGDDAKPIARKSAIEEPQPKQTSFAVEKEEPLANIPYTNLGNQPVARLPSGYTPNPESLSEEVRRKLASLSPDSMINGRLAYEHQPFIYLHPGRLYIGPYGTYHNSITAKLAGQEAQLISNAYNGRDDLPSAVGRIGVGFQSIDKSLAKATIVSLYAKAGSGLSGVVQGLVQSILQGGFAPTDALLSWGGHVRVMGQASSGPQMELSSDAKRLGELQVAMHLGAWPDGRRLTQQERAMIQKELGLDTWAMKKNPWQQSMEKAGIINPGQKWWAPYSESQEKLA